jgi:flagellar basal-body rod protein FlgB
LKPTLFSPTLDGLERVLDLRSRQHALVSTNIANANTPEFRARRIDFRAALDRLSAEGLSADTGSSVKTPTGPVSPGGDATMADVDLEAPVAWAQNGNSVHVEEEMVILSENNLLYNATAEIISRKLGGLLYAASDGGK